MKKQKKPIETIELLDDSSDSDDNDNNRTLRSAPVRPKAESTDSAENSQANEDAAQQQQEPQSRAQGHDGNVAMREGNNPQQQQRQQQQQQNRKDGRQFQSQALNKDSNGDDGKAARETTTPNLLEQPQEVSTVAAALPGQGRGTSQKPQSTSKPNRPVSTTTRVQQQQQQQQPRNNSINPPGTKESPRKRKSFESRSTMMAGQQQGSAASGNANKKIRGGAENDELSTRSRRSSQTSILTHNLFASVASPQNVSSQHSAADVPTSATQQKEARPMNQGTESEQENNNNSKNNNDNQQVTPGDSHELLAGMEDVEMPLDPIFKKDPFLSAMEMELLFLGEESGYLLGDKHVDEEEELSSPWDDQDCENFQYAFIWMFASASLRVALRQLSSDQNTETTTPKIHVLLPRLKKDRLVCLRFHRMRKHIRWSLNNGYRRPLMRKHIAQLRINKMRRDQERLKNQTGDPGVVETSPGATGTASARNLQQRQQVMAQPRAAAAAADHAPPAQLNPHTTTSPPPIVRKSAPIHANQQFQTRDKTQWKQPPQQQQQGFSSSDVGASNPQTATSPPPIFRKNSPVHANQQFQTTDKSQWKHPPPQQQQQQTPDHSFRSPHSFAASSASSNPPPPPDYPPPPL